jgi:hypothetical protein
MRIELEEWIITIIHNEMQRDSTGVRRKRI